MAIDGFRSLRQHHQPASPRYDKCDVFYSGFPHACQNYQHACSWGCSEFLLLLCPEVGQLKQQEENAICCKFLSEEPARQQCTVHPLLLFCVHRLNYTCFFSLTNKVREQLQNHQKTRENTEKLWKCAKEPGMTLDKLSSKSAYLAMQDPINLKFAKQLFQFEAEKMQMLQENDELPPHMNQAIPQKLVDMEKNEPHRMYNLFLELKGLFSLFFFEGKFGFHF
jgi:hypothetical protein